VKTRIQDRLRKAKRRIERRLAGTREDQGRPMFAAENVRVELADKVRAIGVGGIGVVHRLAQEVGLVDAIDRRLHLLKIHRPYHESDHVLNLAYNALCDGTRLEDIELRRNDEVFLDALGTERIPDPTTAGDFCRRFGEADIRSLLEAADEARLNVWARQPKRFFERATIDMDGTLVVTTGECKAGMDISYKGTWGYHPLQGPGEPGGNRRQPAEKRVAKAPPPATLRDPNRSAAKAGPRQGADRSPPRVRGSHPPGRRLRRVRVPADGL